MAHRTGVAPHHAARDGAVSCDEAVRNARQTMMAVDGVATCVGVGGAGLEAARAVTASPARRGVGSRRHENRHSYHRGHDKEDGKQGQKSCR